MAFQKKTWNDRKSEFPTRRKLTDAATGDIQTVLVARDEGLVTVEGNPYNAQQMNDLEARIETGINTSTPPRATGSVSGIVTLSDAINSTSGTNGGVAATPAAAKAAYDRGSAGVTAAGTAQTRADNAYNLANTALDKVDKAVLLNQQQTITSYKAFTSGIDVKGSGICGPNIRRRGY